MSSLDFAATYTALVEAEMRATLSEVRSASLSAPGDAPGAEGPAEALYRMSEYHLGWRDHEGTPIQEEERTRLGGKRLRPVLCLLACEAISGSPNAALPAAAGIEFIHNFSLIHDDIEDRDEARRHRPTVWKVWGVPQAINVGSNMQALVYSAASRTADRGLPSHAVAWLLRRLTDATLRMTEGQFLDMSFEQARQLSVEEYWTMVGGKTAALLTATTAVGAGLGLRSCGSQGPEALELAFERFGRLFGLAFQARDDYLGVWGQTEVTGKPVYADLLRKKKSLPVAFSLANATGANLKCLRDYYASPTPEPNKVPDVLAVAEGLGAREYVQQQVEHLTDQAFSALEEVRPSADAPAQSCAFDRIAAITRYALDRES
ncbi:MAG TPA: polyprenyl synthetase family protein [Armatimonadota bacterium]|jgi:geranylgeranyl diphosphate synthase type I